MKLIAVIFLSLITLSRCVFEDREDSICTSGADEKCIYNDDTSPIADTNMIDESLKDPKRCDEARRYCTKLRQSGTDYVFPHWEGNVVMKDSKPDGGSIPNPCFWIATYCHGIHQADYFKHIKPTDPFHI